MARPHLESFLLVGGVCEEEEEEGGEYPGSVIQSPPRDQDKHYT